MEEIKIADRDQLSWIKIHEPWRLPKSIQKKSPNASQEALNELVETSEPMAWDFMKLTKIKGIGEERARDIGRAFPSEIALIGALKDDTVPFRNDVVKLLKDYFQINKQEVK